MAIAAACAGPANRQEVTPETTPIPLVVTTTGAAEFLARELLLGIADTRMLGLVVPRDRRAEPTPDEEVRIAEASMVIAYGGDVDPNAVEMVKRLAPERKIITVREGGAGGGFSWLEAANLREDARRLHELLKNEFESPRDHLLLDNNLATLDARLISLEVELEDYANELGGQRVFTDDTRLHPFLESLGIQVVATVALGMNGAVEEGERASIAAQAADLPVRILMVTHPEKKEQLGELAREADMTLVYFNPFFDGVTGVGQIDSVIPRQLSVLRLALHSALASNGNE